MAEFLSQNEIDSLLTALSSDQEGASEETETTKAKSIKVYDFRHPDRFSKDQIRTLEMLHDQFARFMATVLSGLLRSITEVRLVSIDQLAFEEFIQSVPKPTSINVITLSPLKGKVIVEISPALSFTAIDRLMGGSGNDTRRNRELTDIEKAIIRKIIGYILESLQEAWRAVIRLEPTLELMETNPQVFMQLYMPTEMIILLSFEVSIGGQTGTLSLCIPYVVVEPVARQLSSRSWFSASKKESSEEVLTMIEERVKGVTVEMIACLGATSLKLSELLGLRKEDVIPLRRSVNEPIDVEVENRMCFKARLGKLRRRQAVEIVECVQSPLDR